MNPNRRSFLKGASALGFAALTGTQPLFAAQAGGFELANLPYGFDALEPVIDAKTMEIHWGRHHKAYVDNLNKAFAGKADWLAKPVDQILKEIGEVPPSIKQAVINNGGGHSNHTHFWKMMKAGGSDGPTGNLKEAIVSTFGSLEKLQALMTVNGMTRFGSGWTWLVKDQGGKLSAYSTANQDSPLMKGHTPILGIDVWEHAYYLKYQNKRADYLAAWWKVVNWTRADELFA